MKLEVEYLTQEHLTGFENYKVSYFLTILLFLNTFPLSNLKTCRATVPKYLYTYSQGKFVLLFTFIISRTHQFGLIFFGGSSMKQDIYLPQVINFQQAKYFS